MRQCERCKEWEHLGLSNTCPTCDAARDSLRLPCLYCGDPVSLADPSVACPKPECQDMLAAAYEGMDDNGIC